MLFILQVRIIGQRTEIRWIVYTASEYSQWKSRPVFVVLVHWCEHFVGHCADLSTVNLLFAEVAIDYAASEGTIGQATRHSVHFALRCDCGRLVCTLLFVEKCWSVDIYGNLLRIVSEIILQWILNIKYFYKEMLLFCIFGFKQFKILRWSMHIF